MAVELVGSILVGHGTNGGRPCAVTPQYLSPLHTHTEQRFGAEEQWPLREEQVLPEVQCFQFSPEVALRFFAVKWSVFCFCLLTVA